MAKAEYRSAIRSRRLINAALVDLLQEKPLDKITVTDIVRRADINRGTFYAHYSDVPDVINHLVEQAFFRIRDAITDLNCPIHQIPGIILRQVQTIMEEDLDFFRKVMDSNAAPLLIEPLCSVMLEYLFEHEADFSVNSHENYVFLVRFCAKGLSGLYQDWFAGELPMALDELTARAEALLIRVMSSYL